MKWLLAGLIVVVAAGVGWHGHRYMQLQHAVDNRKNELAVVRQQRMQMQRDMTWWNLHRIDYQLLVNASFIGKDARVTWYRQLNTLSAIAGVQHAEFDILAKNPSQPEQRIANRVLMETPVHWHGEVAHEGVLADVLAKLESGGSGLFSVRSCDLTHEQDDAPIVVDCAFVWQVLELS
ncbi:hypothetical protein [Sulfuriferula nivalis]|uniref:Uncharacterized protein n=1 Tax=Sulfuriferula nivalis TaxID=2675298 RepID=A0A809SIM6_9PROT|nr:hypothetical protein [Sulfuriferula nivalis]BBP02150.1 hypothetical protein SFSGTM_28580 [Sulfuriferula nivalis]